MAALDFNQDLVTIINEPLTCTEVESRLADVLTQQGYVKDSYKQAIPVSYTHLTLPTN